MKSIINRIKQGDSGYKAATIIYDNDIALSKEIDAINNELEANKAYVAQINASSGKTHVSVLQCTGSGTTDVMSQAAVTSELNKITEDLNNLCEISDIEIPESITIDNPIVIKADLSTKAILDMSGRDIALTFSALLSGLTTTNTLLQETQTKLLALTNEVEYIRYVNFIKDTISLKSIAQKYIVDNQLRNIQADMLVSQYGRSYKYNSIYFDEICGSLTDPIYLGYKQIVEKEFAHFPLVEYITINNTTIDVAHFWCSVNGLFKGHGDICGWAGDLVQFAQDIKTNPEAMFPSGQFGKEDWNSDADAYNIYNVYSGDVINNLDTYWRTITENERIAIFKNDKSILERFILSKDYVDAPSYLRILMISHNVTQDNLTLASNKMNDYLNLS